MTTLLANMLLVAGVTVMVLAAVGILRMPDVYTRMHAATKPASLGVGLLLAGAALHFSDMGTTTRAILTTVFVFLTIPVGAHMLGRAAYFNRVERWDGTVIDELEGRHDPRTHELASG
jgi:multicomponent Na+:H+ antiporter subunit G